MRLPRPDLSMRPPYHMGEEKAKHIERSFPACSPPSAALSASFGRRKQLCPIRASPQGPRKKSTPGTLHGHTVRSFRYLIVRRNSLDDWNFFVPSPVWTKAGVCERAVRSLLSRCGQGVSVEHNLREGSQDQ